MSDQKPNKHADNNERGVEGGATKTPETTHTDAVISGRNHQDVHGKAFDASHKNDYGPSDYRIIAPKPGETQEQLKARIEANRFQISDPTSAVDEHFVDYQALRTGPKSFSIGLALETENTSSEQIKREITESGIHLAQLAEKNPALDPVKMLRDYVDQLPSGSDKDNLLRLAREQAAELSPEMRSKYGEAFEGGTHQALVSGKDTQERAQAANGNTRSAAPDVVLDHAQQVKDGTERFKTKDLRQESSGIIQGSFTMDMPDFKYIGTPFEHIRRIPVHFGPEDNAEIERLYQKSLAGRVPSSLTDLEKGKLQNLAIADVFLRKYQEGLSNQELSEAKWLPEPLRGPYLASQALPDGAAIGGIKSVLHKVIEENAIGKLTDGVAVGWAVGKVVTGLAASAWWPVRALGAAIQIGGIGLAAKDINDIGSAFVDGMKKSTPDLQELWPHPSPKTLSHAKDSVEKNLGSPIADGELMIIGFGLGHAADKAAAKIKFSKGHEPITEETTNKKRIENDKVSGSGAEANRKLSSDPIERARMLAEAEAEVKKAWNDLPNSIKKHIVDELLNNNIQIVETMRVAEKEAKQAGYTDDEIDRLAGALIHSKDANGNVIAEKLILTLAIVNKFDGEMYLIDSPGGVFRHEIMHALDILRGKNGKLFSDSAEFMKAFEADKVVQDKLLYDGQFSLEEIQSLTDLKLIDSDKSPAEVFAQIMAIKLGGCPFPHLEQLITRTHPNIRNLLGLESPHE